MAYADFSFYKDTFKGLVITDETIFESVSERASDYINAVTFGRINKNILSDIAISDKIKRCCCALAEINFQFQSYSQGKKIQSESNGKYSVSYAVPSINESNAGLLFKRECIKYLGDTGLMYRGVSDAD